MALINEMISGVKNLPNLHDETDATYYVLQFDDGSKVLQIDTVGRNTRDIPGKVSQSVQFSPVAIAQLKSILTNF